MNAIDEIDVCITTIGVHDLSPVRPSPAIRMGSFIHHSGVSFGLDDAAGSDNTIPAGDKDFTDQLLSDLRHIVPAIE